MLSNSPTKLILVLLSLSLATPALALDVTPSVRVRNSVVVREAPLSASPKVANFLPGQRAMVEEDVAGWYRVSLSGGLRGFVSKRWVDLVEANTAEVVQRSFELHVIDVGIGDGIILDMGDREILIDGGMNSSSMKDYVEQEKLIDGPIELAIVTHADMDHWKGMSALLFPPNGSRPYQVMEFWEPGYDRGCRPFPDYDKFVGKVRSLVPAGGFLRPLEAARSPDDATLAAAPFTVASLPGVTFRLLHSQATPTANDCGYQINNASIVLSVEVGGLKLLLTGDANGKPRKGDPTAAPTDVEELLLQLEAAHPGTLKADILKVPHHGSETANTADFIAAVAPDFALISASTNHHLPRGTVVNRYELAGATVLRTDAHRERDVDHIICKGDGAGAVVCNYADQF